MKIERPKSKQPIPKDAKRVHKGIVFDVFQWEQEMFDGSKQTFEKVTKADTVNVIPITEDGKVILLKQQQPGMNKFLSVAGGRIEKGDDVLSTAKRELVEETGHESDDLVLWDSRQPVGKLDWAAYTFIARNCKKIGEINPDSGEKMELMFVDLEGFVDAVYSKEFRDDEVTMKLLDDKIRTENNKENLEKLKKELLG